MSIPQVKVHYWRYENGMVPVPPLLKFTDVVDPEFRPEIVGWYCRVYDATHQEDFAAFAKNFLAWMEQHCPTADCVPRINSGDPMITVHIVNQEEAAYFRLNFSSM